MNTLEYSLIVEQLDSTWRSTPRDRKSTQLPAYGLHR